MEINNKTERIFQKVVTHIKNAIASQDLLSGDPLPPERVLMKELGISRSSLREGFRVLELLGLIESIPGKGRFVRQASFPPPKNEDPGLHLEGAAILELMEARKSLDPAMTTMAAEKGTDADFTRLRKILATTAKDLDDVSHRAQSDYNFHLAIAEATHNFLFVNIVQMEFNLIMATHKQIYTKLQDRQAFLLEHQNIYEAIKERSPQKAASVALNHIERIHATLKKKLT